jgi:hypothetical protein
VTPCSGIIDQLDFVAEEGSAVGQPFYKVDEVPEIPRPAPSSVISDPIKNYFMNDLRGRGRI